MSQESEDRIKRIEDNLENLRQLVISMVQHSTTSFTTIDRNFDIVNDRLTALGEGLETLSHRTDGGFNEVTGKIDVVDGKVDKVHEEVKKIDKVSNYSQEFENLLRVAK